MAKRFTDTDKWKRPWFRNLNQKARWVWLYLLDNCDNTGVWIADYALASFQLGFTLNEKNLTEWLGEKLVRVSEDKFFIPSFVEFQYGELNPGNNAHKPVIKLLEKLGPIKLLNSPYLGAQDKDKDKDQTKDKDNTKFDFEKIYAMYPRKEGKADGIAVLQKTITSLKEYEDLEIATKNYARRCEIKKTDPDYIKLFSSFIGPAKLPKWKEWIDWVDDKKASDESLLRKYEAIERGEAV